MSTSLPDAESTAAQVHRAGAAVWAKEAGWPWWPAMVITPETAQEHPELKGKGPLLWQTVRQKCHQSTRCCSAQSHCQ